MFTLEFEVFLVLYVSLGSLTLLGLWFFYDVRDARLYQREGALMIFHCIRCGHLYSKKQDRQTSNCPGCGFENAHLRF